MSDHPDPVTARLIAEDPEARAHYERFQLRYRFVAAMVAARQARGWTQAQLAEAVGTTQSAIARLEGGDQDPRLSTVGSICAVLDIPWSVGETEPEAS